MIKLNAKKLYKFWACIYHKLEWTDNIKQMVSKIARSLYCIKSTKNILSIKQRITLYYSLVYHYLDYGIILWGASFASVRKKLFVMQKKAVRTIAGVKYNEP